MINITPLLTTVIVVMVILLSSLLIAYDSKQNNLAKIECYRVASEIVDKYPNAKEINIYCQNK